jgi:tetratricopeptide (TPR) repeat protein
MGELLRAAFFSVSMQKTDDRVVAVLVAMLIALCTLSCTYFLYDEISPYFPTSTKRPPVWKIEDNHLHFVHQHFQFPTETAFSRRKLASIFGPLKFTPWTVRDRVSVEKAIAWLYAIDPSLIRAALRGDPVKLFLADALPPPENELLADRGFIMIASTSTNHHLIVLSRKAIQDAGGTPDLSLIHTLAHELAHMIDHQCLLSHNREWIKSERAKLSKLQSSMQTEDATESEISLELDETELPSLYAATDLSEDFAENISTAVEAEFFALKLTESEQLARRLATQSVANPAMQYSYASDRAGAQGNLKLARRLASKARRIDKSSPDLALQEALSIPIRTWQDAYLYNRQLCTIAAQLKAGQMPKSERVWQQTVGALEFNTETLLDVQSLRQITSIEDLLSDRARLNLRLSLASSYYCMKDFQSAEDFAKRAVAADKDSAAAYKLLGEIRLARNNFLGAIDCFRKAATLGPLLYAPVSNYWCSKCYYMLGRDQEAISMLEICLQKCSPKSSTAPLAKEALLRISLLHGDYAVAKKLSFETDKRVASSVNAMLGYCWLQLGCIEKARSGLLMSKRYASKHETDTRTRQLIAGLERRLKQGHKDRWIRPEQSTRLVTFRL